MSKSALSMYLYGLYGIAGVGIPFIFMPDFALGLFGLAAGEGLWVRMVGLLAGIIGAYYVMAVVTDTERLYAWSVPARYVTGAFMAVMVVIGKAGLALLLFAAIDALTGSLTWLALRADADEQALA